MNQDNSKKSEVFCPSARAEMDGSLVFGVVQRNDEEAPRVGYLTEPIPVDDAIILLTEPVQATEVFRFAAPCAGGGCQHFDGAHCQLAQRVANRLPEVVEGLPPCRIRSFCRWWRQEGKEACLRCPQIITDNVQPTMLVRQIADPRQTSDETLQAVPLP
ncbi:MAG: nitrogen fixation protein [Chloroflexi bacterium]|nr:nitrogen fixation protein [Chloroflexota bacterium]